MRSLQWSKPKNFEEAGIIFLLYFAVTRFFLKEFFFQHLDHWKRWFGMIVNVNRRSYFSVFWVGWNNFVKE